MNNINYAGYYGWYPQIRFTSIQIQLLKYYFIHHQNRSGLDPECCSSKRNWVCSFLHVSKNWNSSFSNWRSPDLDQIDPDQVKLLEEMDLEQELKKETVFPRRNNQYIPKSYYILKILISEFHWLHFTYFEQSLIQLNSF